MVGQSNMEGHGYMQAREESTGVFRNGTLEWMVETFPETYGKLKNAIGGWTERENVWVSYNKQFGNDIRPAHHRVGKLKAGFGGGTIGQEDQIGPELGFGWTVGDALGGEDNNSRNHNSRNHNSHNNNNHNILLIKTAWGGKSLAVDFRPPSAGGTTGLYYEAMMASYFKTIAELDTIVPSRMLAGGYELAGFAWHQGWNDGCDANMTASYEENLGHLIRDVRVDLGVPDLPVAIGVSGMCGWQTEYPLRNQIAGAQLAVAKDPGFVGTVATAETRSFFREAYPVSPGKEIYHWNNNCESYWLVGVAMGEAMVGLVRRRMRRRRKNGDATNGVAKKNPTIHQPGNSSSSSGHTQSKLLRGGATVRPYVLDSYAITTV